MELQELAKELIDQIKGGASESDVIQILTDNIKENYLLDTLSGLVSDVGNLLSENDIEWQQAGYYNHAKELIKKSTE